MAFNEEKFLKDLREDLGIKSTKKPKKRLTESYVVTTKNYNLNTELLSDKNKKAHLELLENYVETLNKVSAKLDSVSRDEASLNHSEFRALKIDETYNANAAFLHGMFFDNISDQNSIVTMDSLAFLRLERDFGNFDSWQQDFIACAMSARNGWACTVYNSFLQRYMNIVIDLHSLNVPIGCYPVIVLDCWEHSYYKDYLKDRKTYVYAMMKELNWKKIEERFQKAEKLAKVMK